MAAPTPYELAYDFTSFQTSNPTTPLPADKLEIEFNALQTTTDEIIANLGLIQRTDGQLANNSVGVDQLKSEISLGLNAVSTWVTGTNYVANDGVYGPAPTYNGILYRCLVAHQAGVFATDLGAGKWEEIVDHKQFMDVTEADATAVEADLGSVETDLAATEADLVLTNADVTATEADLAATESDLGATESDLTATNADVTATEADLVATEADLALTGADLTATEADLLATEGGAATAVGAAGSAEGDAAAVESDLGAVESDRTAVANDLTSTESDLSATEADLTAVESDIASIVDSKVQDFRLTLTSGTPVTTSDVTGATIIYCTPYVGNQIALYDGANWNTRSSSEFSLALGTLTASRPYDVFCYDNTGTPTLEFTAWTNTTTRATALTRQNGVLVKSGDATRRYLGTFYTGSTTQTQDAANGRYLWNYYHRVRKHMKRVDTTDSWTYTTATLRQANGSTANQLNFVIGVDEDIVEAEVNASVLNTNTGQTVLVGIGLDSTTTKHTNAIAALTNTLLANQPQLTRCTWRGNSGAGFHYLAWLEISSAGGTTTWYGDAGNEGLHPSGMTGSIMC